jgi:hypothetical protein
MADYRAFLGLPPAPQPPATPVPGMNGGMLGYGVRKELYPGEQTYFQQNPNVAGMASESGHVLLNPHSPPGINKDAVARNEAFRLLLQDKAVTPAFGVTPEQRTMFAGTPYEGNEGAMRSTIAARAYSGDPSITPTQEQRSFLAKMLMVQ